MHLKKTSLLFAMLLICSGVFAQKKYNKKQIDKLKNEVAEIVQQNHKQTQVMIDKIFSFAELGFQEYESSKYLTGILKENGFEIVESVSGIPTAWFATWSNGEGPTIAIGSDVDCIPKASQYPGVAYHKPMVEGAPGHGEGHNSGIPLNITSVVAVKEIMEREGI
mgnify:CR=1 FL=1